MIEWYEHHGRRVAVRSELKGQHRAYCLCHAPCRRFKPNTPENCPKAARNYKMCCEEGMTTPVFECPEFEQ